MAATSTVRACNERVTCLRIFADTNGETHMEDARGILPGIPPRAS